LYYLGLDPGEYIARIDSEQLKILNMVSSPALISFKIRPSIQGDIVDNLNFTMTRVTEQITGAGLPVDITKPVKDVLAQTKPAVNEFKANEFISYIFNEGISLQTGAFKNKTNAFNLFKKLVRISGKPTIVVYDHKYYKVRVSGFLNHLTARKFAFKLTSLKFPVFCN